MKKIISIFLSLVILAILSLSVFAATGINEYEQKVLDKLIAVKITTDNGWVFTFSQENINGARNYFLAECDMTEEEMDIILGYIDEGVAKIKEEAEKTEFDGTKFGLSKMSQAARDEVLQLGQSACDEVDLNMSYDAKAGEVIITHEESNTPVFQSSSVIKSTGKAPVNFSVVSLSVVAVLVLGSAFMFLSAKKNSLFVK